ncbi:MAG: JAB domain-containing protein [Tetragenococcus halophilus]|nr:JAB domain-containing protein [Tetragenococcus halophilus]
MKSIDNRPFQYEQDQERFVELIKKYTGIPKKTLTDYLKEHKIQDMYEHPDTLNVSEERKGKLQEIAEIRRLYQNLRDNNREYKLNNDTKVRDYFTNYYSEKRDREYVAVAFLNNQLNVIKTEILSEGTVDSAMISPREVAKKALIYDAKAAVMSHNHPGGSSEPSIADIEMTKKTQEALGLFDIHLVDHIIVAGEGRHTSIKGLGYVSEPVSSYSQNLNEESTSFDFQSQDDKTSSSYENYLKDVLKKIGHEVTISNKSELLHAHNLLAGSYIDMVYDEEQGFNKIEEIDLERKSLFTRHLESRSASLFSNGVSEVIVSPSAKKEGMYQLTYFDKYGASMDSLRSSKEECVRELQSNHLVPLRKDFAEFVRELNQNETIAKSLNFLTDKNGVNHFHKLENEPLKLINIESVRQKSHFSDYNIQLEDKSQNRYNYTISSPKRRHDLLEDWSKEMNGHEWLSEDIKSEAVKRKPNLTIQNPIPQLSEEAKPLAEFVNQEKTVTQRL